MELLQCNDSQQWGAQIMRQYWLEEVKSGFAKSKLSNQCNHRYKIYAECYALSAEAIGKGAQDFMEGKAWIRYMITCSLITEYSKLLDFKPTRPSSALEVCSDSLLCFADEKQRNSLERSTTFPFSAPPCKLQPPDSNLINSRIENKRKVIQESQVI